MSTQEFARLRVWADQGDHVLQVTAPTSRNDQTWHVSVDLASPVKLHAVGNNVDLDAAAAAVIEQLIAVGEVVA